MKKKHFYSHLVAFERISIELDMLDMSEEEKAHLLEIASTNLHIRALDLVMDHLSSDDKDKFLEHVHEENHQKTWEFLRGKIEKIEEKIIKSSEELLSELRSDIAGLKKK